MDFEVTITHFAYLLIAILLDVIANLLIKQSDGFRHKKTVFLALFCVLISFTALSFAIRGIQLSVAYSIWGGLGLLLTSLLSIFLFRERINVSGWIGMVLVISGVILMRMAHLF